jgi:hypothetical protein
MPGGPQINYLFKFKSSLNSHPHLPGTRQNSVVQHSKRTAQIGTLLKQAIRYAVALAAAFSSSQRLTTLQNNSAVMRVS